MNSILILGGEILFILSISLGIFIFKKLKKKVYSKKTGEIRKMDIEKIYDIRWDDENRMYYVKKF